MGFLDKLFGKAKSDSKVPATHSITYSETEKWAVSRLDAINQQKATQAKDMVDSISDTCKDIDRYLEKLDAEKPQAGIHEKFTKIAKISKPTYVKKMRGVLDALNENEGSDVVQYHKQLSELLDVIGKISFGEGRYLMPLYSDLMNKIQASCKQVYDDQVLLSEIVSVTDEENQLLEIQKVCTKLTEAQDRLTESKHTLTNDKNKLQAEKEKLGEDEQTLDGVLDELKSPKIKTILQELETTHAEKTIIEDKIFTQIGRLKKPLKKFAKEFVADSKLVGTLIDEPINGFLAAEQNELSDMFERFKSAVSENAIIVKDKDKTLTRIADAQRELSTEIKEKHTKTLAKSTELEDTLKNIDAFAKEKRIRQQIEGRKQAIKELEHVRSKVESKVKKTKSDIKDCKKSICEKMGMFELDLKPTN